jgi:putative restriction endonuclease
MVKAVLTAKIEPTYDDLPEERYHFPSTYLAAIRQAVGDWVVYYEPRRSSENESSRGGRLAYFGVARVVDVVEDPNRQGHYYAQIEGFLEFARPVPFKEGSHYYEAALKKQDGTTNKGAFGRAVRPLPDAEFEAIFKAGFATVLTVDAAALAARTPSMFEDPASFERPIIERVIARPFRDAAFAAAVKEAYDATCAVTGLKIIDGGGRAEVQAAHIRPVNAGGSDSVRNGLALCGTAHWMFDRGLISISDDFRILIAKDKLPEDARRLLRADGRIQIPPRDEHHPSPASMRFHRDHVFKG